MPAERRHLAIHEHHLVELNERDRQAWPEAAQMVRPITTTGTAAELRDRLAQLEEEAGVTEVAYQPAGDIPTELARFAAAAGLGS